jgi:hypothetical protein
MLKRRVSEIQLMNLDRIPRDRAGFGSTVHLRDSEGAILIYQLVMPEDADAEKGMISTASPIGRAILNKEAGDEVKVVTPAEPRSSNWSNSAPFTTQTSAVFPSRRTALVLCGTGAHGAYHAGVLRAFQEAGVRIDLVAGHGVGAAGAMLSAIDGSGRLWEPAGIWRSPQSQVLYPWTQAMRVTLWALLTLLVSLLIPTFLLLLTPSTGSIRPVAQVVIAVVIAAIASIAVAAGVARSQWQGRRRASGAPWSGIAVPH